MTHPAPLPSDLGPTFRVDEALRAGVSSSRLRRKDLERPFHGVRVTTQPGDLHARAGALVPLLVGGQWFSGVTAAELQGLRMPERTPSGSLHVTALGVHRSMRRPGVVGHKTSRARSLCTLEDGLPVSTPVEAWAECAAQLTLDELIVMGDGLLQRRGPRATADELEAAVRAARGRGSALLRDAYDQVRSRTDSARETMLRLAVIRAGFPEPRVNEPIRDVDGVIVAHGDLVWPQYRVALEYDGRQHAEDPRQFSIDIRRLDDIAALHYRVIRVDRQLFAARSELFTRIARALHEGGWQTRGR